MMIEISFDRSWRLFCWWSSFSWGMQQRMHPYIYCTRLARTVWIKSTSYFGGPCLGNKSIISFVLQTLVFCWLPYPLIFDICKSGDWLTRSLDSLCTWTVLRIIVFAGAIQGIFLWICACGLIHSDKSSRDTTACWCIVFRTQSVWRLYGSIFTRSSINLESYRNSLWSIIFIFATMFSNASDISITINLLSFLNRCSSCRSSSYINFGLPKFSLFFHKLGIPSVNRRIF